MQQLQQTVVVEENWNLLMLKRERERIDGMAGGESELTWFQREACGFLVDFSFG